MEFKKKASENQNVSNDRNYISIITKLLDMLQTDMNWDLTRYKMRVQRTSNTEEPNSLGTLDITVS